MKYADLRDFIAQLQIIGELKPVDVPVSPHLEMTEVCDRTLRAGGPALLFRHPTGHAMPVLGNLFGTPRRVALGMGAQDVGELRRIGQVLATLKEHICMVLVEQNLGLALSVADDVALLGTGRVVFTGTREVFEQQQASLHGHLGIE